MNNARAASVRKGIPSQVPPLTGQPAFLALAFPLKPFQLPLLEGQRRDVLVVFRTGDESHDGSIRASTLSRHMPHEHLKITDAAGTC